MARLIGEWCCSRLAVDRRARRTDRGARRLDVRQRQAAAEPGGIAALARLVEAQERAEANYAQRIAALSDEWVTHARRRAG